jgi:hypothetical protein
MRWGGCHQWSVDNNLEVGGHGIFQDAIRTFDWKDGKNKQELIRIATKPADI